MNKLNKGFTLVELLVVIGILGILMGVLVPQITGSMFTANLNAMKMNGSKLIKAIVQENASGEAQGKNYWAHESEADGKSDDTDRIDGMTFGTSTLYFKELFDIDNQTSDWQPVIDKELLSTLWGFGVPPATPGNLAQANVGWTIVSGMPNDADGTLPVLVSRNVDTSEFAVSGQSNDMSTKKTVPSLDKFTQPFAKKGAVIVYKSGDASAFKARDARICDIYSKQPNVSFADGITLKYLEP